IQLEDRNGPWPFMDPFGYTTIRTDRTQFLGRQFPSASWVSITPDNVNRFNYFQQDELTRQIHSPAGTGIAITKTARPFQESKASVEKGGSKRAPGSPSRQTTSERSFYEENWFPRPDESDCRCHTGDAGDLRRI